MTENQNNATAIQAAVAENVPVWTMQSGKWKPGGTWHDESKWVRLYQKDAAGAFVVHAIGVYTKCSA